MRQLGKPKLTDEDVRLIGLLKAERERYRQKASSLKDAELARKFEVSEVTVSRIPMVTT